MSIKRWVLPTLDKEAAAQLSEECEINPFLALLLITRGIRDAESAADFLIGGDIADDPFGFADMDLAVDRLQRAIDSHEKVAVYGDYDADGITSTVLLYSFLKDKGSDVLYYLPNRETEGYGLHTSSIDYLQEQGVQLIVTVDNGISAAEEVAYAKKKGIDIVVTDHHQPSETLPEAVAVVDPHRADCGSQFKEYAGVGVAFKLICALEGDSEPVLDKYGDLVAIGTLADVMPLKGENRALVRAGLRKLNENRRLGIQALKKVAGIENKSLTSTSVVFTLVPRINAAGRMDSPDQAARLLLTDQNEEAEILANGIQECNNQRQQAESAILKEVLDKLQQEPSLLAERILVIDGDNWHPGVLGIIAARIVERYGKPCILLTKQGKEAKGSGRSIKGFSLFEAIKACEETLSRYGGHELAAGVGLHTDAIPAFRERINAYAAEHYGTMPIPELMIDFKLRPSQVDVEKLNLLAALEPVGCGNPPPVFGLFQMKIDNIMPIGQGKHIRLSVSRDDTRLSVVKFNATYETFPFECGQIVNLVVTLERNEYRGIVTPSVLLKDIRAADVHQEELIQAQQNYDRVMRREPLSPESAAEWTPDREQIERTYRFLRKTKKWCGSIEQLSFFLQSPKIEYIRLYLSLEILRQAGLLSLSNRGDALEIVLVPPSGKADLNMTPVLSFLHSRIHADSQLENCS